MHYSLPHLVKLHFTDNLDFVNRVKMCVFRVPTVSHAHLCTGSWCQKTKIQSTTDPVTAPSSVHISGNPVDVVESFTYLGSEIQSTGSSELEVRRWIALAKSCFNPLNRGIWRSSISLPTKVQLYHTKSIQPVLLYGCETWALTRAAQDKVDAFDNMCLRSIHVPRNQRQGKTPSRFTAPLSQLIQARWLRFFGHVTRMDMSRDITRALKVSIRGLPKD